MAYFRQKTLGRYGQATQPTVKPLMLALMAFSGFGKSLLWRPASAQSSAKCRMVDSVLTSPSLERHFLTKSADKIKVRSFSPIGTLLFSSSPSTVIRAIAKTVVGTFKGVLRGGSFSHVFHKLPEVIPLRTYLNSSSPIVIVATVFGVIAPLAHLLPDGVNRMMFFRYIHGSSITL